MSRAEAALTPLQRVLLSERAKRYTRIVGISLGGEELWADRSQLPYERSINEAAIHQVRHILDEI